MINTKAKTIQLLLYDGTLSGVINIADSAWSPGEMYASPRETVNELIELDKYGVYLLLSDDRVYVGQAQDLKRRIKQHLTGKLWWEKVVLLTTQDDSFTRTDIDYLESVLISMAENAQSLDSDNKKRGNNPKVDKFRKVNLDQYLDEALFLMELIGISVFASPKKKPSSKKSKQTVVINSTTCEEERVQSCKPALPDDALPIGQYVKTAMINLQSSGYRISNEMLSRYTSIEGSKQFTTRNLPMLYRLNDGQTRDDLGLNIRRRYWKDIFLFGESRFLMYSQWYDNRKNGATKEEFLDWYETL